MKREHEYITVGEFNEIIEGSSDKYQEEERETVYADMEKGYENIEMIIERIDGKFFKIEYSTSPYHEVDSNSLGNRFPLSATEVFPKTKTITIYE